MVIYETGIQPKSVFLVPARSILPCVLVGSSLLWPSSRTIRPALCAGGFWFTVALFLYHPSCLVCWWVLAYCGSLLVGVTCLLWLTMQHTKWVSQFVDWKKPYFWNCTAWQSEVSVGCMPTGCRPSQLAPWALLQFHGVQVRRNTISSVVRVYLFLPRNTHRVWVR